MFATMKKMYRFLFAVAAAATALVGCVREPEMLPAAEEHPIQFIAESIETRTAFGDPTGNNYPTLWTANDTKVKIMNTMFTGSGHSADAAVTPSADGAKASLVATLKDTTTYTFYAVSPASAFLNMSARTWALMSVSTFAKDLSDTADMIDVASRGLIAPVSTAFARYIFASCCVMLSPADCMIDLI